jgi:diguanylate cyclase (GGDEF)-like protein
MPRLLRTRYLLGFVCAASILVLVGIAILFATERFRSDSRLVAHTYQVIGQIESIRGTLLSGLLAQRNYLLTGDAAYRAEHDATRTRERTAIGVLVALVSDNPPQAQRASQLGDLIEKRLDSSAEIIRIFDSQGLDAAQRNVRANHSSAMTQQISQLATSMQDVELHLLALRQPASDRSARQLIALGALGIPISLAILIWIYLLLSREAHQRERVEAQTRSLNDALNGNVVELERATADLRELGRYAGQLQSCRNMSEALETTRRTLASLLPECGGSVYLLRASRDYAEAAASWGMPGAVSHPLLLPHECWALRRGQPYVVDGNSTGMWCAHVDAPPAGNTATTACVPLVAHGTNLGFLYLSDHSAGPLSRFPIMTAAAEQLSLALGNLSLQETLRTQSIRDVLTGLFNRRYLEESLDRELARCQRRSLPLALMMLDLDHFKAFNDNYGHEAGDILLAAFGRLLQAKCRTEDIPCRYGGEEFTLILPEADLAIARRRAEDILAATTNLRMQHMQRDLPGITVSIGLAMFPLHANGGKELLRVADAALYRAKHGGRNRVEVADAD